MASLPQRRASGARWLVFFVAAYAAQWGLTRVQWMLHHAWWDRGHIGGGIRAHEDLYYFVASTFREVLNLSALFLGVGTLFALGIALARVLRRRGSAPSRWSLTGVARRYPTLVHRVIPVVFGGLWFLALSTDFRLSDALTGEAFHLNLSLVGHAVGSLLAAIGAAAASRAAVRALDDAPVSATETAAGAAARPLDDSTFTAVAVTPTTRGAVGALALASIAMTALVVAAPMRTQLGPAVIAYVLAALGAATLFRYVSRIVVGIDGVLVTGMGRTRVFGYAMFDEVREGGELSRDILLLRGGRVLVRLQLPDDEAPRVSGLVARLRDAMDRAAALRNNGADLMMQMAKAGGAASDRLASSSRGTYRQATMAREQLWELVEGPFADADARTIAAEALAPDLDAQDRSRLRVAAEHSADPRVRLALLALADDEDEAPAVAPKRATLAR